MKSTLETLAAGPPPDVILCDLLLLDGTGMEIHAWVVENRPELEARMIFASGGTYTPATRAFMRDVAVHRLVKPFPLGELEEIIEQVLDEQNGNLIAELPIDTAAPAQVDFADNAEVAGPAELNQRIVESGKVASCLSRQYFAFALRRELGGAAGDRGKEENVLSFP